MTSPETDRELLSRVLRGNEQAFDTLVDEYYPRLYRFAFRRLGADPEATQDVVQSTFEKLIPRLGSFRGEAALFSWMCSFCRFEIAAHWRRVGLRPPEVPLDEDSEAVRAALDSLTDQRPSAEQALERRQLGRLVRVALDHLPVRYGNALEWKYIHGLSVAEVAARLGTSPKAAESVLTRARQAFRDGFAAVIGV